MTSRRELKNYAKQAMSGKYGILILAFVAVQALALISSMISSALFPGEETIDIVLSYAFTFILTLLINVVAAGMNYMYLNIARGKVYSLNDLFYFYRHHPDRVIVAGFFMAVLNLLTMLPYTIYSNANLPGEDASVEVLITWLYTGVVLMIVGMIVYQILVIPLEMTYYILADKPELKSTEAMKESLEMMHGNFGRYLMLKISFIPLMFLSVFTFYIALLWIFPYMAMTEVMFYRDLTGELKVQKEEEERVARDYVNPMFDSYSQNEQPQEDQTHPQQFWSVTGDSSVASDENKEVRNNAASENTQDKTFKDWPEMVGNIIPYIGGEEEKSEKEPLRIWGKVEDGVIKPATEPVITCQCIRVPVLNGHTAAVFVKFRKNPTKEQLIKALVEFKGLPQELELPSAPKQFIQYLEEDNRPQVTEDVNFEHGMGVSVGRLREDTVYDWKFVGLSHNTVRGAAGGAVLCAETLKAKGYIQAK